MNLAMWEAIAKRKTNAAIHCPTRELAEEVVTVVRTMTGRGFLDNKCDYWSVYEEDTCYYPNVGAPDGRHMQYSDLRWAEENDMIIYEAIDLLTDAEFSISLGDVSIKSLFGME